MANIYMKTQDIPATGNKYLFVQPDGYYPDMTAGQITTNIHDTNSVPYIFRPTPYNSTRESGDIVGASVAWNQLISNGNFNGTTGWSKSNANWSASSNVLSFTPTATSSFIFQNLNTDAVANHKYLASAYLTSPVATTNTKLRLYNRTGSAYDCEALFAVPANTRTNVAAIFSASSSYQSRFYFYPDSPASTTATYLVDSIVMIDLTVALGSTIADYLYTLESGTAGAGVAKLREWGFFTKPYYAYNAGGIESVNVSKHRMTGLNQWDEEWELGNVNSNGEKVSSTSRIMSKNYIPIFPNTPYYAIDPTNGDNVIFYYYDVGFNYLGNSGWFGNATKTTPANAHWMYVVFGTAYGTTYKNDVCVNISGAQNGTYEPYIVNEYALDSDLTLRGVYALDANNNLKADGDVYHPDGTVNRNWSETPYTLPSGKTWTAWGQSYYAYVGIASQNNSDGFNAFSDKLPAAQAGALFDGSATTGIGAKSGNIYISASDYANLSNLIGMNIYIRKATPTTETANAFTSPQVVSPYGTEEFVDAGVAAGKRDVAIPCGHNTEYMKNIVGAIEGIPLPPSANGTYTLKVTVASGVPTYSWVSG